MNDRSISKSLFALHLYCSIARLSQTTSSLDDNQGSSRSSGSDEAKQLNSYISSISIGTTPPADALDTAEASVSQVQLHRTCLHLPLKLTLREFSPFVGC